MDQPTPSAQNVSFRSSCITSDVSIQTTPWSYEYVWKSLFWYDKHRLCWKYCTYVVWRLQDRAS